MAQLEWQTVKEYEEITFKQLNGVARIAFNRKTAAHSDMRNAFQYECTASLIGPKTVYDHCHTSFALARQVQKRAAFCSRPTRWAW